MDLYLATALEVVAAEINGRVVKKEIIVPGRLVNLIV